MNVYWLEQTEADVPQESDWLSARELVCLNKMRFAKRRTDWRLGRWTAKLALAVCLDRDRSVLTDIEILAAPSGAPEAYIAGRPEAVTISLSHRAGTAICAVAQSSVALGCDLEMIEAHSDAFVADYFTSEERDLIRRECSAERLCLIALLWSAKESALKALHTGLRIDTRCVTVSLSEDETAEHPLVLPSHALNGWRPLHVECNDRILSGWWQRAGLLLRTLVACPSPDSPTSISLSDASHSERI